MKNILIGAGALGLNVAVATAGYLGVVMTGDKIKARRNCEVNEEELQYGQVGNVSNYYVELARAKAV